LRVDFVRKIFPDSPIIHIVREGKDASCSIRERWKKPADFKYIIKNRAFPIKEAPFFVQRQIKYCFEKLMRGGKHVKWWGPEFDDYKELIAKFSLIEICGIQWKRCTEAAIEGLEKFKPDTFTIVRYEDLVSDPVRTMEGLFGFLDLDVNDKLKKEVQKYVQPSSVGRWRNELTDAEYDILMDQIRGTLERLEYI
jgi:hypothetical protein